MIDINRLAEDFDKVREIELQERGAGVNAERLRAFLQELTALSDKYEIYIGGCGCCGSPWLNDIKAGEYYDNLTYGQDNRYKVDE